MTDPPVSFTLHELPHASEPRPRPVRLDSPPRRARVDGGRVDRDVRHRNQPSGDGAVPVREADGRRVDRARLYRRVIFIDFCRKPRLAFAYIAGALLLIGSLYSALRSAAHAMVRSGAVSAHRSREVLLVVALSSYLVRSAQNAPVGRHRGEGGGAGYVDSSSSVADFRSAVSLSLFGRRWSHSPASRGVRCVIAIAAVSPCALHGYSSSGLPEGSVHRILRPSRDTRGAAYNVAQARIAIRSGGWFGKDRRRIAVSSLCRPRRISRSHDRRGARRVGILFILRCFGVLFQRFASIAVMRRTTSPFAIRGAWRRLPHYAIVNAARISA